MKSWFSNNEHCRLRSINKGIKVQITGRSSQTVYIENELYNLFVLVHPYPLNGFGQETAEINWFFDYLEAK